MDKHIIGNIIHVFTDGACRNNGKPTAKAGIGIYFGETDPRNCSERVIGKQSNNTAELTAILKIFDILKEDIKYDTKVIIYSDSQYSIDCFTKWSIQWAQDNWTKKNLKNIELVKQGYTLFQMYPCVQLIHVKAHTGGRDFFSIGNEHADRLANLSIGVSSTPTTIQKVYLQVSYEDKEIAKDLGAKWDPKKKKWYYNNMLLPHENIYKLQELFL
jgi:ribonuclease HI